MTAQVIRIAVLGVGRIGAMHAELVARQVPGASLAMVQDVNAAAAEAVGARARRAVHRRHRRRCSSSPDVDAVAICSQHRHPRRRC